MEAMPGDVLDEGVMMKYFKNGQMFAIFLPILFDIPNAYAFVGES